jgi:hypothetical protein
LALENIARRQMLPCPNKLSGCLDWFSIDYIDEHISGCVYREIECPMIQLKSCYWKGHKSDLEEHAKAEHPNYFFDSSQIRSELSDNLHILSCFGQLFVHYQQTRDGILYGAVRLIGTGTEASNYKCEFTLLAENGVEQISKTIFVRGYADDWETIFNSGRCLQLDEQTESYFLYATNSELTITLSTVQ